MEMISNWLDDDINWDVWGLIIETSIHNLILLSLNENPDKPDIHNDIEKYKNYLIRIDVLTNNVGKHPLLMPSIETLKKRGVQKELNLANFVEYAKLVNWDIPLELSQLASNKVVSTIDKPLTKKERQTLLVIIAALAKEAKIDITRTSKAGDLIANMTQILGAPIGATTIENYLKEIPDALESRAK